MSKKDIVEEFVIILQYYMDYYGLYNIDIKNLLSTTTDIVKDLKTGKNGPTIKKADSIACLFGLKYYEFANPDFPLLEKEKLPPATRAKIDQRKEIGPPKSRQYNKLDLNHSVLNALKGFKDKKAFLPSEVFDTLPEDLKTKLGSATRVTGLFSDELKENVEKTGNKLEKEGVGRKQEYYKVISLEWKN
jgi:hypothetical protein